jgi:hypothetical protein
LEKSAEIGELVNEEVEDERWEGVESAFLKLEGKEEEEEEEEGKIKMQDVEEMDDAL